MGKTKARQNIHSAAIISLLCLKHIIRLDNVDFTPLETDNTIHSGKQREVSAHTYVCAGQEFCPALTDDNGADFCRLVTKQLYAPVFRITVAPVFTGALSFFMCHNKYLSSSIGYCILRQFILIVQYFLTVCGIKFKLFYGCSARNIALISPSDKVPSVISLILPCGSMKKAEGMEVI